MMRQPSRKNSRREPPEPAGNLSFFRRRISRLPPETFRIATGNLPDHRGNLPDHRRKPSGPPPGIFRAPSGNPADTFWELPGPAPEPSFRTTSGKPSEPPPETVRTIAGKCPDHRRIPSRGGEGIRRAEGREAERERGGGGEGRRGPPYHNTHEIATPERLAAETTPTIVRPTNRVRTVRSNPHPPLERIVLTNVPS